MATLQELRQRKQSIRSIEKIMSAMKVVAATKLRQLEEVWKRVRQNRMLMTRQLQAVARKLDASVLLPCFQPHPHGTKIWLVIGADRGLCGGFNGNLFREFARQLEKHKAERASRRYIFIGKRLKKLR